MADDHGEAPGIGLQVGLPCLADDELRPRYDAHGKKDNQHRSRINADRASSRCRSALVLLSLVAILKQPAIFVSLT